MCTVGWACSCWKRKLEMSQRHSCIQFQLFHSIPFENCIKIALSQQKDYSYNERLSGCPPTDRSSHFSNTGNLFLVNVSFVGKCHKHKSAWVDSWTFCPSSTGKVRSLMAETNSWLLQYKREFAHREFINPCYYDAPCWLYWNATQELHTALRFFKTAIKVAVHMQFGTLKVPNTIVHISLRQLQAIHF